MPGFNQTGPMGQGPKTGRRMGRCSNLGTQLNPQSTAANENSEESIPDNLSGRGMGLGRGRGGRGQGLGRQNRFRGGV